jgi:hypothetical protein
VEPPFSQLLAFVLKVSVKVVTPEAEQAPQKRRAEQRHEQRKMPLIPGVAAVSLAARRRDFPHLEMRAAPVNDASHLICVIARRSSQANTVVTVIHAADYGEPRSYPLPKGCSSRADDC